MFTLRGGNPLGPAGTGKTETVKVCSDNSSTYTAEFGCVYLLCGSAPLQVYQGGKLKPS